MKRNWMKLVLGLNIFVRNPSDALHRGSEVSKVTSTNCDKTFQNWNNLIPPVKEYGLIFWLRMGTSEEGLLYTW
jgi:hypothetical protein